MTEHSRGIAAFAVTAVPKPVRSIPTRPPAARFLLRGRNRGKSAAGLRPCTPVRRALKRRGQRFDDKQAGVVRESAASDGAAGKALLLFRMPFAAPAQGRPVPWLPLGEAGAERLMREHNEQIYSYHGYDPFSQAATPAGRSFPPDGLPPAARFL